MKDTALKLSNSLDDFFNHTTHTINWENEPTGGKWTNKEIIGHLIDSAQINLQRFVRCTYEENFKLIYFQEEWVQAQHYKTAHITDLLKLWELLNRQIVRVLTFYPENRIHVKCDNGRYQPSFNTVAFLAEDYIVHMQHHLKQLN